MAEDDNVQLLLELEVEPEVQLILDPWTEYRQNLTPRRPPRGS